MKFKTILHLTGMRSTKYGSMEHYLLELSKMCHQKGYKSVLQYEMKPLSETYLNDLKANNTDVITLKTDDNPFSCLTRIIKLIRLVKPDIINTHFIHKHVLFFVPVIARMSGVKKIVHIQHSIGDFKRASSVKRYFYKNAYNKYDWILGVSSAVTDDMLNTGMNTKRAITHNLGLFGKSERSGQLRAYYRKQFGVPENGVVIGCIAFDTPFKGLDILLDAFSKLIDNHSYIYLIIIGVDPSRSDLPKQAARLGLSDSVHWAGIIDEGWKLLNAADVYVQPSRFGEGLSLAILEAMALKLPVVATRVAGNAEAVSEGESGYLCEPESVNSLIKAFEHILLDQDKWKTMGEAGFKRFKHTFWGPTSIKNLLEKYYQL